MARRRIGPLAWSTVACSVIAFAFGACGGSVSTSPPTLGFSDASTDAAAEVDGAIADVDAAVCVVVGARCASSIECCSGVCESGVCRSDTCAPGDPPSVVLSGVGAAELRVDDRYVYAAGHDATGGIALRVPKRGGEPQIYERAPGSFLSLTIDGAEVFWTVNPTQGSTGEIHARIADATADARVVAAGLDFPRALALQGNDIYVGSVDTASIIRIPRAGGSPTPILQTTNTWHIIAEPSRVYFVENRARIAAVDPDGTNLYVIAKPPFTSANALDVDATAIWFMNTRSNPIMWVLTRWAKPRGPLEPIAELPIHGAIVGFVVDDTNVYWLDSPDVPAYATLKSISKSGGATRDITSKIVRPTAIAVDATCVYWSAVQGGEDVIMKIAK